MQDDNWPFRHCQLQTAGKSHIRQHLRLFLLLTAIISHWRRLLRFGPNSSQLIHSPGKVLIQVGSKLLDNFVRNLYGSSGDNLTDFCYHRCDRFIVTLHVITETGYRIAYFLKFIHYTRHWRILTTTTLITYTHCPVADD